MAIAPTNKPRNPQLLTSLPAFLSVSHDNERDVPAPNENAPAVASKLTLLKRHVSLNLQPVLQVARKLKRQPRLPDQDSMSLDVTDHEKEGVELLEDAFDDQFSVSQNCLTGGEAGSHLLVDKERQVVDSSAFEDPYGHTELGYLRLQLNYLRVQKMVTAFTIAQRVMELLRENRHNQSIRSARTPAQRALDHEQESRLLEICEESANFFRDASQIQCGFVDFARGPVQECLRLILHNRCSMQLDPQILLKHLSEFHTFKFHFAIPEVRDALCVTTARWRRSILQNPRANSELKVALGDVTSVMDSVDRQLRLLYLLKEEFMLCLRLVIRDLIAAKCANEFAVNKSENTKRLFVMDEQFSAMMLLANHISADVHSACSFLSTEEVRYRCHKPYSARDALDSLSSSKIAEDEAQVVLVELSACIGRMADAALRINVFFFFISPFLSPFAILWPSKTIDLLA